MSAAKKCLEEFDIGSYISQKEYSGKYYKKPSRQGPLSGKKSPDSWKVWIPL